MTEEQLERYFPAVGREARIARGRRALRELDKLPKLAIDDDELDDLLSSCSWDEE